jgi:type I restriction enzyme M protein
MPKTDNANYLWIQHFYSSLNDDGRAGFVMANSASDAGNSELEIRKQLIKSYAVDVMVAVGSNMFYTVTLPCQLWFLDKYKLGSTRQDKVLFLDVRHIFRQIDRAHREFTPKQIEFIANIVKLYKDEEPEFKHGSEDLFKDYGLNPKKYSDVLGLCKVANVEEIEARGWTLNPGRYVGVNHGEVKDLNFIVEFEKLSEDLSLLNASSHELENIITVNAQKILDNEDC